MTDCAHEKFVPPVDENMFTPLGDKYNLMQVDGVKINMCKLCHLLYWGK